MTGAAEATLRGTVVLVGAGPGDPGLLTIHGQRALSRADVVVYDRLCHPQLLAYAPANAEVIYAGKGSDRHVMKQDEINAVLVDRALAGRFVVRLKGGDPFVFGRGGEEAEACIAAGIPFRIVPGITSAIAAPAYAGIPVTHRDFASSFAVITGHERSDERESGGRAAGAAEQRRNWSGIAQGADTLIFLMGVEAIEEISTRLQENGRSASTPAALVQWGTWPRQRVIAGTLENIASRVRAAGLKPPAVCIVGEVARLRDTLQWFDDPAARPMFGTRVLVTRAREQASALTDRLRELGADPIEFPVIRIEPLADYTGVDAQIAHAGIYNWVILTSANGADHLRRRMDAAGVDARIFGAAKFAAIGPATALALREQLGIRADYVPDDAVAEGILAGWPEPQMAGKRVWIPRALEARDTLPDGLRAFGAAVDVTPLYETVMDGSAAGAVRDMLQAGEIDAVTFTSSSTVRNLEAALAPGDRAALAALFANVLISAIGPITASTAAEVGIPAQVIAEEHTIPGLCAALARHYAKAAGEVSP